MKSVLIKKNCFPAHNWTGREAKLSGTDRTQPLSSTDDDSEYLLAEQKKKKLDKKVSGFFSFSEQKNQPAALINMETTRQRFASMHLRLGGCFCCFPELRHQC